jgi:hypothetical protein
MVAREHLQRLARRTHATLFQVFHALTDAFLSIRLCGDIQQSLIGFGILHDRFGLSINRENERFLVFLRCFMNFAGLRRNVVMACMSFFISNMKASHQNGSTLKGAIEAWGVTHRFEETKRQTVGHTRASALDSEACGTQSQKQLLTLCRLPWSDIVSCSGWTLGGLSV